MGFRPTAVRSDSQINFQCPCLPEDSQLKVTWEGENGISTSPVQSAMQAAAPGVFTLGTMNRGAIFIAKTDKIAMTKTEGIPSRPAEHGEYLDDLCHRPR